MSAPGLANALELLCSQLTADAVESAKSAAREQLPLPTITKIRRAYSPLDLTKTAMRDGFIDRYTGARLVFPGTLRLVSILLPEELSFHPNWAYDRCHPMYWDLYPSLDHIHPIARGGTDTEDNWVVTSQRMNSAKGHWTLEELKWQLVPCGSLRDWDGLVGWFVAYTDKRPALIAQHKVLRAWRQAVLKAHVGAAS